MSSSPERALAALLSRETILPVSVSTDLASLIVRAVNDGIVPPIVPKRPGLRQGETT